MFILALIVVLLFQVGLVAMWLCAYPEDVKDMTDALERRWRARVDAPGPI